MTPNGRRAWRRAAKKLRCKMGRRWRSQEEWVHGKRWSEFVPDLEAHRGHIRGAWFKRHGFTEQGLQKLDSPHPVRVYIGLWGTADGDGVEYAVKPQPFTARSLVGMSEGAKKRVRERIFCGDQLPPFALGADSVTKGLRIGQRLRPCPGCFDCAVECWVCHEPHDPPDELCGGSGVIRAGKLRPLLRKPDCGFYID